MIRRLISRAGGATELIVVVVAAAVSRAVPGPANWASRHHGVNILLAVLVLATGLTMARSRARPAAGVAEVELPAEGVVAPHEWQLDGHSETGRWPRTRVAVALVATTVVLPALSWAAAHIVRVGALRKGVIVVGLAPAEIVSVATTSLAGGDPGVAAVLLLASTAVTVLLAGPVLAVLTGGSGLHVLHLLVTLVMVVVAPMAAGLTIRAAVPIAARAEVAASRVSVAAIAALVALVSARVELSRAYVGVILAVAVFMIGSGGLGILLGRGAPTRVATGVMLTTSMRDFAIAASIAETAFGPAATGPLGVYGVLVIVWGMAYVAARR